MKHDRKRLLRIIDELEGYLEDCDADSLRPQPEAVEIEVTTEGDKGPMEKLAEEKGVETDAPAPEVNDEDDMDDDELDELVKEHLR